MMATETKFTNTFDVQVNFSTNASDLNTFIDYPCVLIISKVFYTKYLQLFAIGMGNGSTFKHSIDSKYEKKNKM